MIPSRRFLPPQPLHRRIREHLYKVVCTLGGPLVSQQNGVFYGGRRYGETLPPWRFRGGNVGKGCIKPISRGRGWPQHPIGRSFSEAKNGDFQRQELLTQFCAWCAVAGHAGGGGAPEAAPAPASGLGRVWGAGAGGGGIKIEPIYHFSGRNSLQYSVSTHNYTLTRLMSGISSSESESDGRRISPPRASGAVFDWSAA